MEVIIILLLLLRLLLLDGRVFLPMVCSDITGGLPTILLPLLELLVAGLLTVDDGAETNDGVMGIVEIDGAMGIGWCW